MLDSTKISKSVLPMFIFNWIFGIGVIEYPLGTPHPIISFVYSLICVVTYCSIAALTYLDTDGFLNTSKISLPIRIFFFSNILLTVATLILGWYRSESLHKCLIKAAQADDMMSQIGIKNSFTQMMKQQIGKIVVDLAYIVIVMVLNSMLIILNESSLRTRILQAIAMFYPVLVMFIADATFMNIVKNVSLCARYRFQKVNEVLKNMITSTMDLPQHKRVMRSANDSPKLEIYIVNGLPRNHTIIIRIAKQTHLLIIKICQDADNMYGMQILLSVVATFAIVTGNLYILYLILFDAQIPRKFCFIAAIWIFYYAVKIGFISFVCSSCVEESVRTGDILNELYDDPTVNSETQYEVRDFNIQLIQRPLKFTAYGFLDLDFTLIQGMISSITTYLMILIQLGKLPSAIAYHRSFAAQKDY